MSTNNFIFYILHKEAISPKVKVVEKKKLIRFSKSGEKFTIGANKKFLKIILSPFSVF